MGAYDLDDGVQLRSLLQMIQSEERYKEIFKSELDDLIEELEDFFKINKMPPELQPLGEAIFEATQKAFLKLFENGEHYYYCVLLTTGEALPPCIAAWSVEALERFVNENAIPQEEIPYYKYSFADSPYYAFGYEEYFQQVKQLFEQRDSLIDYNNEEQWNEEYNLRLAAMVYAMKKLDASGIFALNQPREQVYINVELMPPDDTDIERALSLNNPDNIEEWLSIFG